MIFNFGFNNSHLHIIRKLKAQWRNIRHLRFALFYPHLEGVSVFPRPTYLIVQ